MSEVRGSRIILEPVNSPRKGWEEAFKEMAKKGDGELIDMPESIWDEKEWEWIRGTDKEVEMIKDEKPLSLSSEEMEILREYENGEYVSILKNPERLKGLSFEEILESLVENSQNENK